MTSFYRFITVVSIFAALPFVPARALGQNEIPSNGDPASSQRADDAGNQDQSTPQSSAHAPVTCGVKHTGQCLKDLGNDQAGIWTSPLHIRSKDADWIAPLAAATAVAFHYDADAQQNLGVDNTRINASSAFSNVGPYGSMAAAGGLYFLGTGTHNDHLAEAGRLGGEAIINSLLVVQAIKLATDRQRPNEGDGRGAFWPGGASSYSYDGGFPSGHAAATFAFARVIAAEYPQKRVQFAAYAFALAVSVSRVTAREHFPSDVLVGGTLGYLIGGYVVRHRAANGGASTLLITPLVNGPTRTYGLHVEFTPSSFDIGKVRTFLVRTKNEAQEKDR